MSQLPDEALTYQSVVAEYFLALRGAGLMLSPLDLEQVRAWERRGVPVAVVCRGLRRAVEDERGREAAPAPRSIRRYRLAVEDEWRAYRSGRVGDAPAPPDEATAARRRLEAARALLDGALRALPPDDPRRAGYRAAGAALGAGDAAILDEVEARLAAADAALVGAWLRALPRRERAAVGIRCRLVCGARAAWTRRAEHRAVLRVHVLDAAREAGLLCLRGSV